MFLPTTKAELKELGWHSLDVIIVTGDCYIDSPFIGAAVIGKVLFDAGFKVGIIAQPDLNSSDDIGRLGQPNLFWGVTGGSVDSMVANYTASKKRRKSDDYTPGGLNCKRPDRAVIAYTNLIKRYFKSSVPVVLGGIEASLRRVPHYDFWSNKIRGSILFDSKADYLLYGMAEKTIVALANSLKNEDPEEARQIAGLCYISKNSVDDYIRLPDLSEVKKSKQSFTEMFHLFYQNNDPLSSKGLCQKHDSRFLVHNPPAPHLSQKELDRVYELNYMQEVHPFYRKAGKVNALSTIQFSITSHRGCYGECNFCAIAVHQGRTVVCRSEKSIIREAKRFTELSHFKGIINDVGGPTGNMYGYECPKKFTNGCCKNKRCLTPQICTKLPVDHSKQIDLLRQLRSLPGIRKVFMASGLRYDLIKADPKYGLNYMEDLVKHHISGQIKIAPEHIVESVLDKMGKQSPQTLMWFKNLFQKLNDKSAKEQFITYYFIAAHPGCKEEDMISLKQFCLTNLKTIPRQIQIFTPTPSTYSTLMYYTEKDPFCGKPIFVEKDMHRKENQKNIILKKTKKQ